MHVITVIPISKSKISGELSYFTSTNVPIGAIVSVPLRSKNIHAIVTSINTVEDVKSEIKNASFQLKKLDKIKANSFFPAHFIVSSKFLADYYATSIGTIIDSIVSDSILENAHKISLPNFEKIHHDNSDLFKQGGETLAIQGDDEDRLGAWRSLIRQEFAQKKSVAIYVPTIEDAKNINSALIKGIEEYIFILHNKLTKKEIVNTWEKIFSMNHPVVIVATGSFSFLPRKDIETIIIERENSRGWIGQKHPYIDARFALETIARIQKQKVYRADSLLRIETLHRLESTEISEGSPFKWRSISNAKDYLIDMKIERTLTENNSANSALSDQQNSTTQDSSPAPFRVLSPDLENLIVQNQQDSTHLFILAIRRGSSPVTVCSDCELIVHCNKCMKPVVLHTSKLSGKNFFMCHNCGESRSANEVCQKCSSWRLTPLGIGIDRVYDEIKEKYPNIDVYKIDADTTKSESQISLVIEKFRSKPGSILLGTEMSLIHLKEKIEYIAVASLDTLFALPDYRIQEKIMYNLIRLRSLASRIFLVQTRKSEEKVFEYALKGNLSDFYRATIDDRKQFLYPPFSTLIKITIEGKKEKISEQMSVITKIFEHRDIDIFPAFTSAPKGNSMIHALLKIPSGGWPNQELRRILKNLPISAKIKIDPESLL